MKNFRYAIAFKSYAIIIHEKIFLFKKIASKLQQHSLPLLRNLKFPIFSNIIQFLSELFFFHKCMQRDVLYLKKMFIF